MRFSIILAAAMATVASAHFPHYSNSTVPAHSSVPVHPVIGVPTPTGSPVLESPPALVAPPTNSTLTAPVGPPKNSTLISPSSSATEPEYTFVPIYGDAPSSTDQLAEATGSDSTVYEFITATPSPTVVFETTLITTVYVTDCPTGLTTISTVITTSTPVTIQPIATPAPAAPETPEAALGVTHISTQYVTKCPSCAGGMTTISTVITTSTPVAVQPTPIAADGETTTVLVEVTLTVDVTRTVTVDAEAEPTADVKPTADAEPTAEAKPTAESVKPRSTTTVYTTVTVELGDEVCPEPTTTSTLPGVTHVVVVTPTAVATPPAAVVTPPAVVITPPAAVATPSSVHKVSSVAAPLISAAPSGSKNGTASTGRNATTTLPEQVQFTGAAGKQTVPVLIVGAAMAVAAAFL